MNVMNTYQKIKFLKFRRHMDAMRIKRLADGILNGVHIFRKISPKLSTIESAANTPLGATAIGGSMLELSEIKRLLKDGLYNKNDILQRIIKSERNLDRFIIKANSRIKKIEQLHDGVGINRQREIQLYAEDIAKAKRVNGILARLEVAFS